MHIFKLLLLGASKQIYVNVCILLSVLVSFRRKRQRCGSATLVMPQKFFLGYRYHCTSWWLNRYCIALHIVQGGHVFSQIYPKNKRFLWKVLSQLGLRSWSRCEQSYFWLNTEPNFYVGEDALICSACCKRYRKNFVLFLFLFNMYEHRYDLILTRL